MQRKQKGRLKKWKKTRKERKKRWSANITFTLEKKSANTWWEQTIWNMIFVLTLCVLCTQNSCWVYICSMYGCVICGCILYCYCSQNDFFFFLGSFRVTLIFPIQTHSSENTRTNKQFMTKKFFIWTEQQQQNTHTKGMKKKQLQWQIRINEENFI